MKLFIYVFVTTITALPVFSQSKRLVVIGSSTAYGNGPTNPDNAYVKRLTFYYKDHLGVLERTDNLATSSTNQFQGMPTDNPMPPDFPQPLIGKNITKANELLKNMAVPSDGVIIVHYPSNEMLNRSTDDIMYAFRTIRNEALKEGHICYIATTQPREDGSYKLPASRLKLAQIKDLILQEFGTYAIDFWTGMFDPVDTTILDIYAAGDLIHLNDAGHEELFNRVVAKDIFGITTPTPLVWGDFIALIDGQQVNLQWSTLQEENTSHFIVEHSTDGKNYTALANISAKGHSATVSEYRFAHAQPNLEGFNFYRIKQVDRDGKATWTQVRTVQFKGHQGVKVRMSPNPVQNTMKTEVMEKDIFISIVDVNGRIVKKMNLSPGVHYIDMQAMPRGNYNVMMYKKDQWIGTRKIVKL